MTRFLWTNTFLFIGAICFGQIEELKMYKQLYATADSLNNTGRPFSIDSLTIKKVQLIDNQHPVFYFKEVGELWEGSKYDDAAFVYYLGLMRYRYYNSVNPEYQSSGDGALAASLNYEFGEMVNLYLKTNTDNFKSALQLSSQYFAENDYIFYSRKKDPKKYDKQIESCSLLIKNLEANRTKYQKQWSDERKKLIENIDKSIEEYNNMTPEEKARLKNTNKTIQYYDKTNPEGK
jgi:hypothetical protein